MRKTSSQLAWGQSEVLPKQDQVAETAGSVEGQEINQNKEYIPCKKCKYPLIPGETLKQRRNRIAKLLYAKNRTERLVVARLWAKKNRELSRLIHKRWRDKNPGYGVRWEQKLKREQPEKYKQISKRHNDWRTQKKRTDDKRVRSLIKEWRSEESFVCFYCKNQFPRKDLNIEHKIPFVRGGKHTCENICKSCRWCNQSKAQKVPEEFTSQK